MAVQYVTFGVAENLFAAPVHHVREILDLTPIASLPRAPSELLGMIDVRGKSVPVIDLRLLLEMPAGSDTAQTRIIVIDARGGGIDRAIGLKTDRVLEVTQLDDEILEAPPAYSGDWNEGAIEGIGRRQGAFVTVLNVERLFAGFDVSHLTGETA